MQSESVADRWAGYNPNNWFKWPAKDTPGIMVRGIERDIFGHNRRIDGKPQIVALTDRVGNPCSTITEAKAAVAAYKAKGRSVAPKGVSMKMKWSELVQYHAENPSKKTKASTLLEDKRRLAWYASALDNMQVRKITKHHVKAFVLEPMEAKGLSSNTMSGALTAVRKQFNCAIRLDLIDTNPVDGLQVGHDYLAPESKVKARVMSPAETAAVLQELRRTPGLRVLVAMQAYAGLRTSEACGMQWEQVLNAEQTGIADTLTVVGQLDRVTREIKDTKTKASVGTVDIGETLRDILKWEWYRQGRPTTGFICLTKGNNRKLNNNGVEETPGPKPYYLGAVSQQLGRACKRANIAEPHPRPHDFRHTFVTMLMSMIGNGEGSLSLAYVSRQARHKNVAITMAVYTHEFNGDTGQQGKGGAAIDRILSESVAM